MDKNLPEPIERTPSKSATSVQLHQVSGLQKLSLWVFSEFDVWPIALFASFFIPASLNAVSSIFFPTSDLAVKCLIFGLIGSLGGIAALLIWKVLTRFQFPLAVKLSLSAWGSGFIGLALFYSIYSFAIQVMVPLQTILLFAVPELVGGTAAVLVTTYAYYLRKKLSSKESKQIQACITQGKEGEGPSLIPPRH